MYVVRERKEGRRGEERKEGKKEGRKGKKEGKEDRVEGIRKEKMEECIPVNIIGR